MKTKICCDCKQEKPVEEFNKKRNSRDGKQANCSECNTAYMRRYYAQQSEHRHRVNVECYAAYGGKCACCGEDRWQFLTMDHINGGGREHARKEPGVKNLARYLRSKGYPEGFQVLCWNCNCGRDRNGGICPHKEKGTATG